MVSEESAAFDPAITEGEPTNHSAVLAENMPEGKISPKYFYEIEFENCGLVMPIIEYAYADEQKNVLPIPYKYGERMIARCRSFTSDKELIGVTVDPMPNS